MFEFVRQHAALLAGSLLLWFTWSAVDAEEKKAAGKEKLPVIPAEVLEVRARDAPAPDLDDPFQVTQARNASAYHSPDGPSLLGELRGRLIATGATLDTALTEDVVEDLVPLLGTLDPLAPLLVAGRLVPVVPRYDRPSFELRLESVTSFGAGGGQARISGLTVRRDEHLTHLDAQAPPLVVSIQGLTVELLYRDESIVLDLDRRPVVHVVSGVPQDGLPQGTDAEGWGGSGS